MQSITIVLGAAIALAAMPAGAQTTKAQDKTVAEGVELLRLRQYAAAGDKFRQACGRKVGEGCYRQAIAVERYRYAPATRPAAVALYKRACDLKFGQSCFTMSLFHSSGGMGLDIDKEKGTEYMLKSCKFGFGAGCGTMGEHYRDGRGVERDATKAFGYFKRGCELGNGEACKDLSLSYSSGAGTAVNRDLAIAAIKKALETEPTDRDFQAVARRLVQR